MFQVVVGLGATGLACVNYLTAQGHTVIAMDSASEPARFPEFKKNHPDVRCVLGRLDQNTLALAEQVVVSPGVSIHQPAFDTARANKVPIVGDIELFAKATEKPIYAITGSNGKTTVTTLLGLMAKAAGRNIAVAGNIGKPVLELLQQPEPEGYLLELSSFQLETTYSLNASAAMLLNLSEDHRDRYPDFAAYRAAKQRIYRACKLPVLNFDAPELWRDRVDGCVYSYSLSDSRASYYLQDGYLMHQFKKILPVSAMRLQGEHHYQNALAALAMAKAMDLPLATSLQVIQEFGGLAHRCQWVRTANKVAWYNDSKATNVGATQTAIRSLAQVSEGRLILIAGGQGKGADFSPLRELVKQQVAAVILFGEDREKLITALQGAAQLYPVANLDEAVFTAAKLARANDCVLLSPACASFDSFANFVERGERFIEAVNAL